MSEYRDTIYLYTDIAYNIRVIPDVVILHPYIPILQALFFRYLLFFYDIGFDIGWQEKWIWSVLISGNDIVY
jgi:hypothetical protein